MGILGRIMLVEHIGRRMIAELKSYHDGDHVSARLLELKCEFNDAICALYVFAEAGRSSFDHDRAVSQYCKAVDQLRDQFALAGAIWIDRVRQFDPPERRTWSDWVEGELAECIGGIHRTLNPQQIALSLEDMNPKRSVLRSAD